MRLKQLRQRGDTIVEVLIATAVIGGVLGVAYGLVNNGVRNNQASQERSVAVKLAETQIETLRSYVSTHPTLPAGNFCLDSTNTARDIAGLLPATSNDTAVYPSGCITDSLYVSGIHPEGNNTYTVWVSWDSLNGPRTQVSIAYKVQ